MDAFRYHRRYQGPIRAIILDWAGTTLDYGCQAPATVFVEVFRLAGVEVTVAEAREPMGAHKRDHIRAISQIPAVAARWREIKGAPCTEADVERMFEVYVPLQIACLKDHAELIPGCLEAVADFRVRGLKIGTTTGYTREMTDVILEEARRRGYEPDTTVAASEVPAGRPEPWMCLENARRLRVWPLSSIVKVDDTLPGVEEGLNAGMWTVALARTGNEMGLTLAEVEALEPADHDRRLSKARGRLARAGAHYVVDDILGVPACLDDIERRLVRGEQP